MFKCEICDKEFDNHRKLNGHKGVHREGGRYTVSRSKIAPCDCMFCGKTFRPRTNDPRKFCGNKCQAEWQYYNITVPNILSGKVSGGIKRFLEERDGRKCSCCNLSEWNGEPIPLDVEHKDGDPRNNMPDNLVFLCPNCHRQTPTWGNSKLKRVMKNGRKRTSLLMRS